jgi:hypothetical protein
VFIYIGALVVSLNPVLTASATQQLLVNRHESVFWKATLQNGDTIPMVAPWVSMIIIYLIVSMLLLMLAVRRMRNTDEWGVLEREEFRMPWQVARDALRKQGKRLQNWLEAKLQPKKTT